MIRSRTLATILLAATATLALSGCHTTVVEPAQPAAQPAPHPDHYDDHHPPPPPPPDRRDHH